MRIFLKLFLFIFFSNFLISKAFSEVSFSGYQEFFAGSADQSTRGALDMSTNTGVSQSGLSNGLQMLIENIEFELNKYL